MSIATCDNCERYVDTDMEDCGTNKEGTAIFCSKCEDVWEDD